MSSNPYTPPQADLDTPGEYIPMSLWNARGRLGVLAYWARVGLLMLGMILVIGVLIAIGALFMGGSEMAAGGSPPMLLILIGLPLLVLAIYIAVCLVIKRLHDLNLRGWWCLLLMIPLVGMLFGLYALLWRGKPDSNRFGLARSSKGWEKIIGILVLVLYIVSIPLSLYFAGNGSFMPAI